MTMAMCSPVGQSAPSHDRATALRDPLRARFDDMTETEIVTISGFSAAS
jgi:hypothetical protein